MDLDSMVEAACVTRGLDPRDPEVWGNVEDELIDNILKEHERDVHTVRT